MRRYILTIIIFIMFMPLLAYAKTCDTDKIYIKSIVVDEKTDKVEELDEATVDGKNLNLNLYMVEVGDNIKYKVVVENDSNEDYELDKNSFNIKSDYINYTLESNDNSNIINANSSKIYFLKVEYKNPVPVEMFEAGDFSDDKTMMVQLSTGNTISVTGTLKNPNTGVQSYIIVILILLLISGGIYILFNKKSYYKYMILIVGLAIIIPMSVFALCKCEIRIESKIVIESPETLQKYLITNYSDNFNKYNGLVTDRVGKTEDSKNVYFAKSQDINNIILGDFCWQIVRTTEQGGAKLIYNGTVSNGKCPSGRTTTERTIGKSVYNDISNSIASVGYMYNKRDSCKIGYSSVAYFGSDVEYNNGVYTLINPISGNDPNHHYTCDSVDINATCQVVKYVYNDYSSYYIELKDGIKINDFLNEMLYADDVNKNNSIIKTYIDNWYENNLNDYTNLLDSNVYCNDRNIENLEESGFNPNGGEYNNRNLLFNNNKPGRDLSCSNITDQFSTSNDKAKLTYPIALITEPERNAGGQDLLKINNWYWGMSPVFYRYDSLAFVSYVLDNNSVFNSGVFYSGDNVNSSYTNNINVRPVISLKKNVKILSGDGSYDNPFIINYSE